MQIELSKMSKIAGNWWNSTNVKKIQLSWEFHSLRFSNKRCICLDEPEPAKYNYQFNINANDLYKLDITRLKQ